MRLLIITTIPATPYYFMGPHISHACADGHEIHLVCGPDSWVTPQQLHDKYQTSVHVLPLRRAIAPLSDIRTLLGLQRLFLRLRPDAVNYSTPKASLLSALAAFAARIPRRIYTNRGLLAADRTGPAGTVWRTAERLICSLSHVVTCNSPSNLRFMVEHKLCPADKVRLLGHGSSHGVDARGQFNPSRIPPREIELLRARLFNLTPDTPSAIGPVYLFVGRLARDKGFAELAGAWALVRRELPDARLLIVGPAIEPWNALSRGLLTALRNDPAVVFAGPVDDPAPYYALCDIVVLPSYREGFPNVPLEAAAMERPCITTDALGCVDSVRHGETGLVVPVRNTGALARAMLTLGRDPALRARMGQAGRQWVLADFAPERIAAEWLNLLTGSR